MMASVSLSLPSISALCSGVIRIPPRRFDGSISKQLVERAHALHLAKLIAEILERELVARELLLKLERFILIDFGLNLFDQREHIAHSQDSLRDSIGIERLDRVVAFAYADEFDRLAGDFLDRKRRASASCRPPSWSGSRRSDRFARETPARIAPRPVRSSHRR